MDPSLKIDADAFYHAGAIAIALDLSLSTLDRARRDGKLRFVRKGQRILIRGQWVLDWLNVPCERKGAADER